MSAEQKLVAILTMWAVSLCLLGFAEMFPAVARDQQLGKMLNSVFVVVTSIAAITSAVWSFRAVTTKNSR
jgi:hypothetical protein